MWVPCAPGATRKGEGRDVHLPILIVNARDRVEMPSSHAHSPPAHVQPAPESVAFVRMIHLVSAAPLFHGIDAPHVTERLVVVWADRTGPELPAAEGTSGTAAFVSNGPSSDPVDPQPVQPLMTAESSPLQALRFHW
jgi:hypothetical protein